MDSAISGAMSDAIDREWIPGGVTLVWHDGALLHRAAHGFSQISPNREKANVETVYDLASLTKPVVTATIAMSLIARGQLALEDPVSRHIGEYVGDGRDDVTINHLLLHTSGLSAFGADQAKKVVDRQSAKDILCSSRNLARPPGELFEYTDLGPILLGFVIETITGEPLERAAKRIIFGPLGMSDTRFCPKDLSRIAPTEEMNGVMLRGTAHDPICRAMGGVAGHAGLFGTADDLLKYAMMILAGGNLNGAELLPRAAVARMVRPEPVPGGGSRALGWDVDTVYSSPRGDLLKSQGIGHSGYTGTSIWIDFESKLVIILLTNRVHPHVREGIVQLRRRLANVVAANLELA